MSPQRVLTLTSMSRETSSGDNTCTIGKTMANKKTKKKTMKNTILTQISMSRETSSGDNSTTIRKLCQRQRQWQRKRLRQKQDLGDTKVIRNVCSSQFRVIMHILQQEVRLHDGWHGEQPLQGCTGIYPVFWLFSGIYPGNFLAFLQMIHLI